MLTIETLENLMSKLNDIISTAQKFGYENLRLFRAPYEEDKDTIHIMGSYNSLLQKKGEATENISESLSELLNCSVSFWPETAKGIQEQDRKEAALAPLLDIEKTINYFMQTVMSYSTDIEPTTSDYEQAKLLLQKYSPAEMIDPTNIHKRKASQLTSAQSYFFDPNSANKTKKSLTNKSMGKALPELAKQLLDQVLDLLGDEQANWNAAEAYLRSKKISKFASESESITNIVK